MSRYRFYRFKFEPSVISNMAILMASYSVSKFDIFSPPNLKHRFMVEQLWDLLKIY